MAMFRYTGPADKVSVGVAGAVFLRDQINEVPDERLAGYLRTLDTFEEVGPEMVPPTPRRISPMPQQGAPHPIPEVAAILRGKGLPAEGKAASVGNLNRDDQYAANTEGLAAAEEEVRATAEQAASKRRSKAAEKPPEE